MLSHSITEPVFSLFTCFYSVISLILGAIIHHLSNFVEECFHTEVPTTETYMEVLKPCFNVENEAVLSCCQDEFSASDSIPIGVDSQADVAPATMPTAIPTPSILPPTQTLPSRDVVPTSLDVSAQRNPSSKLKDKNKKKKPSQKSSEMPSTASSPVSVVPDQKENMRIQPNIQNDVPKRQEKPANKKTNKKIKEATPSPARSLVTKQPTHPSHPTRLYANSAMKMDRLPIDVPLVRPIRQPTTPDGTKGFSKEYQNSRRKSL